MSEAAAISKMYASVEQFATMLSFSACTIHRLIARDKIVAFRLPGGRKWIIDVERSIEKMRRACQS